MKPASTVAVAGREAIEEDRRWDTRNKVLKNVQMRYRDEAQQERQELVTLVDISRNGLYFTTTTQSYQVGMELYVTLPNTNTECLGEVVRTRKLQSGRIGVGVRVLNW
jgi:PilZ domain